MSYLGRLGHGKANYDRFPYVPVEGHDGDCWAGWQSLGERLRHALADIGKAKQIVVVDCYSGILDDEVAAAIQEQLRPERFIHVEQEVFRPAEEIDELVEPFLGGDDPVFGRMSYLRLEQFLDSAKLERIRREIAEMSSGLVVLYGVGASMVTEADVHIYANLARWEAQRRQRADLISNLGVENKSLKASLQYKRSYFIDWRVCDKHKMLTWHDWDFLLDTCAPGEPKLVSAEAYRSALRQTLKRPFRLVPFFDPGVWGGQWMREICQLPDGPPNYAWCFDCVPEENSLVLGFGEHRIEVPSLDLVLQHPAELLGEPVYGHFGAEFPIRFDLLDTMQGQNLSFQVHPLIDYAAEHFGLRYTQDESYYILDADDDAEVFLGLVEEVEPECMLADLKTAQDNPTQPFPDQKHVARFPARRHDHFLIPAGTCHCSGTNSLVLEISHTPYIFTFKLWDWARLGLDGKPRPINLERGKENIVWERTRGWVDQHLVNAVEQVEEGDDYSEERTGLYASEVIETRRHWFTGKVSHDTKGESVHVLNLVHGEEAIVESPTGVFAPYVVHFAETFVVPAAVGGYTIRPHGPSVGQRCGTLKAFVRVNP